MPAYLIGTVRVIDPAAWQRYVERVGATFPLHGGQVLWRGAKSAELNQSAHGDRVVVAQFDSLAALRAWHDSAEYQALVALRDAGADVVLTAYES
jgi:uncharacterized protein (DUF1330 family)